MQTRTTENLCNENPVALHWLVYRPPVKWRVEEQKEKQRNLAFFANVSDHTPGKSK
jgi:hypothetical protein